MSCFEYHPNNPPISNILPSEEIVKKRVTYSPDITKQKITQSITIDPTPTSAEPIKIMENTTPNVQIQNVRSIAHIQSGPLEGGHNSVGYPYATHVFAPTIPCGIHQRGNISTTCKCLSEKLSYFIDENGHCRKGYQIKCSKGCRCNCHGVYCEDCNGQCNGDCKYELVIQRRKRKCCKRCGNHSCNGKCKASSCGKDCGGCWQYAAV